MIDLDDAKSHTAGVAIWLLKSKIFSQNTVFCEGGSHIYSVFKVHLIFQNAI